MSEVDPGASDFEVIRLTAGELSAEVQPAYGGRLLSLHERVDGERIDWFEPARPASSANAEHVRAGCFPMLPYCNRIHGGRFRLNDTEYDVGQAHPWPDACHGHGFLARWSVDERAPSDLQISFRYADADWPSPYLARQRFSLTERALLVELSLTNVGGSAMPGGFGLHPYFPRRREARFEVLAGHYWPLLPGFLAEREEPLAAGSLARAGSSLEPGDALCLSQWKGYAEVSWPGERRVLKMRASSSLPVCVLFAPDAEDLLCIEPSSHVIGGIGMLERREETGVQILEPGDTMKGQVAFELQVG